MSVASAVERLLLCIRSDHCKESNTAKGVNIAIEFKEYKDILFNKQVIRFKMKRIQSKKHDIGTYELNKISLSCFDHKKHHNLMVFIHLLIFTKIFKQEGVLKDSHKRSS